MTKEQRLAIRRQRVQETFQLDPTVHFKLKGKEFILEFNNFAIKSFLKDTGINLLQSGLSLETTQSPELMSKLLLCGLVTNHPETTEDQVDKMYSIRHYPYVLETLRQALDLLIPDLSDLELEDSQADSEQDPT